jgi:hypothetical protein
MTRLVSKFPSLPALLGSMLQNFFRRRSDWKNIYNLVQPLACPCLKKTLPWTNALAYFLEGSLTKKKVL